MINRLVEKETLPFHFAQDNEQKDLADKDVAILFSFC
jgi:hypothetical protein